jgi:hypothetical protein
VEQLAEDAVVVVLQEEVIQAISRVVLLPALAVDTREAILAVDTQEATLAVILEAIQEEVAAAVSRAVTPTATRTRTESLIAVPTYDGVDPGVVELAIKFGISIEEAELRMLMQRSTVQGGTDGDWTMALF